MKNDKAKTKNEEPKPQGETLEEALSETEGESRDTPDETEISANDVISALTDRLQRTMAEFDNFRKRTMKEKASMYDDGVRDTVERLLPAVDNLERALNSAEDKNSAVYTGVEMIMRQITQILDGMGIEALPAEGAAFDPTAHHAVGSVQAEDGHDENTVAEVLVKGYKYREKVIRPSMVKIYS